MKIFEEETVLGDRIYFTTLREPQFAERRLSPNEGESDLENGRLTS